MGNNNYKEKYESLIEAIKVLRDTNPSDEGIQNWIKDFVPELAESEDERIRKVLISILKSDFEKDTTIFDISIERILAWLEKQGTEQRPFTFKSLPRLLGMIEPSDRAVSYSNKLADSLENEGYTTDSKIVRESIKMMRGEKVPLATMDELKEESTGNSNKEVSPKFGVFSWVSDGISTRQVAQVLDCGFYVFDDGFNGRCEDIDSKYHLWTIQDAKNGDVLVIYPEVGSELPEQIFIFKEIRDRSYVKDAVEFHCKYANNEFSVNKQSYMGQSTTGRYLPATRAQRNLLFSRMRKSGYEWNLSAKEVEEIGEGLINFYEELGQP